MKTLTKSFKKLNQTRGFTLIELLVVISIIGLLSSVVIVSLQGARIKAVNARVQQASSQMRSAFELDRTGQGYTGLKSAGDGIAYYGDLTAGVKAQVDDILKQQGTVAPIGYPGGSSPCSGGLSLSVSSDTGVVVTTNSTNCNTPPTEYAIYSANVPKGSSGFTCIDSKGGRTVSSVGGISLNAVNGVCSGTIGGGGSNNEGPVTGQSMYNYDQEQIEIGGSATLGIAWTFPSDTTGMTGYTIEWAEEDDGGYRTPISFTCSPTCQANGSGLYTFNYNPVNALLWYFRITTHYSSDDYIAVGSYEE